MNGFFNGVGRALRETGQGLDRLGMGMMGNYAYKEALNRHRRLMPVGDASPSVASDAFVAPNAAVIGNVTLASSSNVFYGATVRGDAAPSSVGSHSTLQDHVSVSGSTVGSHVTVGPGAVLDNATVHDAAVIGAGATVSGVVESKAKVEPGAVVDASQTVPTGEVWAGIPAKMVRKLSDAEMASFEQLAAQFVSLGAKHKSEHDKSEALRQKDRDFKEFHLTDEARYKETPF